MPEWFRRRVPWAALVLVAGAVAACPSRRQGPKTPNLDQQSRETARRLERTRKIREVMTRDLERFEDLASDLHDPSADLFADPFPLDLFKHVVVECLNAPTTTANEAPGSDAGSTVDDRPDAGSPTESPTLDCNARFVDELDERLENRAPEMRRRAFELLRKVDSFHALRIQLRRRIAKIDEILADNRDLLASRRADLRKLKSRWKQRKSELSAGRWRELQNRFDALESNLEDLERETERLERAAEQWPDAIDRADSRVYFGITSQWSDEE